MKSTQAQGRKEVNSSRNKYYPRHPHPKYYTTTQGGIYQLTYKQTNKQTK